MMKTENDQNVIQGKKYTNICKNKMVSKNSNTNININTNNNFYLSMGIFK